MNEVEYACLDHEVFSVSCPFCKITTLSASKTKLEEENSQLNKALSLKLDSLPSGLSAGQSRQLEEKLTHLKSTLTEAHWLIEYARCQGEYGLGEEWRARYESWKKEVGL